jgi:hypothetical protein
VTRRGWSLVHDDALVVRCDGVLEPLVVPWLPLHAAPPHTMVPGAAAIDVTTTPRPIDEAEIAVEPLLRFDGVRAYMRGETLALIGVSGARGRIALETRSASLHVPPADDARLRGDVYSMLTLASAFLLGRLGGALVHAAGVVDPSGRAWLLVGDTHAGKTTTCVSLVDAGWRYLADDQVVLRLGDAGSGEVEVQGWPRRAHLDEGWRAAVVTGTRATVDLRERWGDRWIARAPLGGVLLPSVAADAPTHAARIDEASAFAALVRQSPWLMADLGAAPAVMSLLRATASCTSLAVSLGRDSYARGDVLAETLGIRGPGFGVRDSGSGTAD